MNGESWITYLVPSLWAGSASGQGFAGLGSDADGFAVPESDWTLAYPEDHSPYPEYRIEWRYLTATLAGEDGRDYGIQWTLFRTALAPYKSDGWMDTSFSYWEGPVSFEGSHEDRGYLDMTGYE